jgi:spore germination protein YaaH
MNPYAGIRTGIPYQYTLDVPGITDNDINRVHGAVEQLQVTMLDGEELDVKAILSFGTTVFQNIQAELITNVNDRELDMEIIGSLPSMVVYFAGEGDNLWNIGRKYYTSVDKIRSVNKLESDELKAGQKLLIVR